MQTVLGIIFIDHTEILVNTYLKGKEKLISLASEVYDLDTFDKNNGRVSMNLHLEMLSFVLLKHKEVTSWEIMARQIDEELISAMSYAANLEIKDLPFLEEQRLIIEGKVATVRGLFR